MVLCFAATASEEPINAGAYAAVPFTYDTAEAAAVQEAAPIEPLPAPAVDAFLDVDFAPTFAVPASLQSHLPKTERMHKVDDCRI